MNVEKTNPTIKYPIGVQNFEDLRSQGYLYVDKTAYVHRLIESGKYYFLSRPRRFGKSLLLSTIEAYYQGKRHLFKGLAIDSLTEKWEPHPILHLDLNNRAYTSTQSLCDELNSSLEQWEELYGNEKRDRAPEERFAYIIRRAYEKTGKKVVILIDEYDKPLLNAIDDESLADEYRKILKAFYSNLKTMDGYIRFAMLTGVARFSKVSIFSDLNNLKDISLWEEYAGICGWTEKELTDNFKEGIEALAIKRREPVEETLKAMRVYYDGYRFTEADLLLYNPFSILNALDGKNIRPFWFSTGTPTFLAQRVKKYGIQLPEINDQWCDENALQQVGLDSADPLPLMFQTGYLTIAEYKPGLRAYRLRFPNKEVETGFADNLYPLYVPQTGGADKPFGILKFRKDLYEGNPEGFMNRLQSMFKEMGFEFQNEKNYQSILWLLGILCDTESTTERHSYKGRSDLEIATDDFIYLFEIKYNGSVKAAMEQLLDRDYAGRFAVDGRQVFLIAVNFCDKGKNRGIVSWKIDSLNRIEQ